MSEDCKKPTATLLVLSDWLNIEEGDRGELFGSFGELGEPAMLVMFGERREEELLLKLCGEEVGDGLLTGEEEPFGEPSLLNSVEEIVFLAACLARSVLTKLDTRSSRLPLRFGEASSSRGPTSVVGGEGCVIWVIEDPRWGDSLVEEDGEETLESRGEFEESEDVRPGPALPLSRLWEL